MIKKKKNFKVFFKHDFLTCFVYENNVNTLD